MVQFSVDTREDSIANSVGAFAGPSSLAPTFSVHDEPKHACSGPPAGIKHTPQPVRLRGTLRSWNDDRGFGFIAPTHGGAELFVHIGALPRDGSRPTPGEKLTYELGRGKDGQPQAVRVTREAMGRPSDGPAARRRPVRQGRPFVARSIGLVLLLVWGAYGFSHYRRQAAVSMSPPVPPTSSAEPARQPPADTAPAFRCDGRTHCSQMSSCTEAKFFLNNCPGTAMDGNRDGTPCEQQWCTSPFAK